MDNPLWLAALALATGMLLISGCNIQYNMLYYPSSSLPAAQSIAGAPIGFWPAPGERYRGFIGNDIPARPAGTFVVFHGNAGTAMDREYYVQSLGSLGYRVILAEYPRYGGRKGELGEASFVKDAVETLRLAHEQFKGPLYLLGESLGAGVASAAARVSPVPISGIVLITPWDSLNSVARFHYPFLPVRLLLKDSYDNLSNLSSFRGKVAIVAAGNDEFVPPRLAQKLYRSLPDPDKRMWVIEKAGHNDWPDRIGPGWWKEITEFVASGAKLGP